MRHTVYIGTYTHAGSVGIYHVALEGEKLIRLGETPIDNPAYLALDGDALYAAGEGKEGGVTSLRVARDGSLSQIGCHAGLGQVPCHVSVAGSHVFAADYGAGTLGVWARDAQGALTGEGQIIAHRGRGPHPTRQTAPHVHQAVVTPDGAYLAVCDLGMDAVLFYARHAQGIVVPAQATPLPAGAGPRHAVFGPAGRWYVVGELSCQVYCYQGYGVDAWLRQRVSTLRPGDGESACAALRLSPDGRWLLATTRGADTFTLFEIQADGLLGAPQTHAVQGCWPRDAAFSPDGRHLLCACERGNVLTAFALEADGPRFLDALALPTPTCVCFVP